MNPTAAFKNLLLGLGRDIDDQVISRIQSSNPAALMTANTMSQAAVWYKHFENLPNTITRGIFMRDTGFVLDGNHEHFTTVIRACRNVGDESFDFLFKILPQDEIVSRRTLPLPLPEVTAALAMVGGPFLVRCGLEEVRVVFDDAGDALTAKGKGGGHRCSGLIMRMFSKPVNEIFAQLSETTLLKRTLAMMKAVNYIHTLDYVHMDIKEANIFVSSNGTWFLGDYGSCVAVGTSFGDNTTTCYHFQTSLPAIGVQLAEYRYDWQMLTVVIAAQLNISQPLDHSDLRESVITRIDACNNQTLRDVLRGLIIHCDRVYEVGGMNELCPDVIDPEF